MYTAHIHLDPGKRAQRQPRNAGLQERLIVARGGVEGALRWPMGAMGKDAGLGLNLHFAAMCRDAHKHYPGRCRGARHPIVKLPLFDQID